MMHKTRQFNTDNSTQLRIKATEVYSAMNHETNMSSVHFILI